LTVPSQASASFPRRVGALFSSRLARASIWLSMSAIATGALAYAFQVVMGRMLAPRDYGIFAAMMALFAVLSAPLSTLSMVLSRKVSEYRAHARPALIGQLYVSISTRALVVGAAVVAAMLLFAAPMAEYLHAPGPAAVYLLGALLLASVPPIINNAFLQGLQRFARLSATGALAAGLKIAFGVPFVALGWGLGGALGAIVAAAIATWLMTYGPLHTFVAQGRREPKAVSHLTWRETLPVLVANASFAAMTQLDMVLVNHYFGPRDAGMYAAASVLGKAVLFLPGGVAMALFPMVAENDAREQGSAHLLVQAVGLTGLLCASAAAVFFVAAEPLIVLFYGESYRPAAQVLRWFGFAMLPMALVLVAEHFLIAKGRVLFAYLFLVSAPLELAAIQLWHPSPLAVLAWVGACGVALGAVGYGLLWREYRRSLAA
jgi:O-antigen/teichoic acid export membrane protein